MRLRVGMWLASGALLMLAGCATVAPPLPPSLELPKPPSDLRATRKGNKVTLTWSVPALTTDRQSVRSLGPTRICRGVAVALTTCEAPVGEAPPSPIKSSTQKITGTYTDTLGGIAHGADGAQFAMYAVEVLNAGGRGAGLSNQVRIPLAPTLPPPQDLSARVTGQGVALTWTSSVSPIAPDAFSYVYRVYRRQEGSQQQMLAVESRAAEAGTVTLVDSNIEWQKTYEYHVEAVTLLRRGNEAEVAVEGEDSPEIKVFADDLFPPSVPSGLQAVFSGPGQQPFIDLIWAPVSDIDLDGYNVYRREDGAAPVKINAELLKTPAYRDGAVVSGKSYSYSVSAVDVRGNESARSEEAEEGVP